MGQNTDEVLYFETGERVMDITEKAAIIAGLDIEKAGAELAETGFVYARVNKTTGRVISTAMTLPERLVEVPPGGLDPALPWYYIDGRFVTPPSLHLVSNEVVVEGEPVEFTAVIDRGEWTGTLPEYFEVEIKTAEPATDNEGNQIFIAKVHETIKLDSKRIVDGDKMKFSIALPAGVCGVRVCGDWGGKAALLEVKAKGKKINSEPGNPLGLVI